MKISDAHRALAEKLIFKDAWDEIPVMDSLLSWIGFIFTEEEAGLVSALSFALVPVRVVSRRAGRPSGEIKPILESLSKRLLIAGTTIKGVQVYGLLPLWPGIFETQMLRAKTEGGDEEYYREFARHYEEVYHEYLTWMKPKLLGKDVRVMRIIPVGRSLESVQGVMPLDTDRYSEIVDRNTSFCLVSACACRYEHEILGKGCGKPLDVCSAMGALADLAVEKGLARRVSKEEFIDAKARAAEAGLINLTDNLHDPLQVCSCCSCCCGVLRIMKNYNIPTILARSHFESAVDTELCAGCATCMDACQMDAIAVSDEKASIDYARCIGCGLCVDKCEQGALALRERDGHKPPSENAFAFYSDRYGEIKGADNRAFLPRLALGIGRILGND